VNDRRCASILRRMSGQYFSVRDCLRTTHYRSRARTWHCVREVLTDGSANVRSALHALRVIAPSSKNGSNIIKIGLRIVQVCHRVDIHISRLHNFRRACFFRKLDAEPCYSSPGEIVEVHLKNAVQSASPASKSSS